MVLIILLDSSQEYFPFLAVLGLEVEFLDHQFIGNKGGFVGFGGASEQLIDVTGFLFEFLHIL